MRTIKAIIVGVACLTAGAANAQWVVHDPGNLAQGIINTTKRSWRPPPPHSTR